MYYYYVLYAFHDSTVGACHLGFKKTYEAMRANYFWKHMYQECYDYDTSCEKCHELKHDTIKRSAPLKPHDVDPIFARWHLDFLCGLPETKNGNKHILLAIDSFSYTTEAVALRSQTTEAVCRALYEQLICRYGVPSTIVTDNAANLCSKAVLQYATFFKQTSHFQLSPCLSGSGRVPKCCTHTICANSPEKWDDALQSVMMAFRMSPSLHSTGYSPFFLTTRLQMNLHIDNIFDNVPKVTGCLQQYIDDMVTKLKIVRETAK